MHIYKKCISVSIAFILHLVHFLWFRCVVFKIISFTVNFQLHGLWFLLWGKHVNICYNWDNYLFIKIDCTRISLENYYNNVLQFNRPEFRWQFLVCPTRHDVLVINAHSCFQTNCKVRITTFKELGPYQNRTTHRTSYVYKDSFKFIVRRKLNNCVGL